MLMPQFETWRPVLPLAKMDRPPTSPAFAFYRAAASPIVGIQLSDLESGSPLPAESLACYRVKATLETPWFKLALLTGSRLFLTPSTAAGLLAAGKIEALMSETLVLHRKGFEAPETARWAPGTKIIPKSPGKPPRKARGSSASFRPPAQKDFAGKPPAKAGMPKQAGGKERPKAGTAASARKR